MSFCRNCGAKIPNPTDKFCVACGTSLQPAPPAAGIEEPAGTAVATPPEQGAGVAAPEGSVPMMPAETPPQQIFPQEGASPLAEPPTVGTGSFPRQEARPAAETAAAARLFPSLAEPASWQSVSSPTQPPAGASSPQGAAPAPQQRMPGARKSAPSLFTENTPLAQTQPPEWNDLQGLFAGEAAQPPLRQAETPPLQTEPNSIPGQTGQLPLQQQNVSRQTGQLPLQSQSAPRDVAARHVRTEHAASAARAPVQKVAPQQAAAVHQTQEIPQRKAAESAAEKVQRIQQASEAAETQPQQIFPGGQSLSRENDIFGSAPAAQQHMPQQRIQNPNVADSPPKPRLPEPPPPRQKRSYSEPEPPRERRSERTGGGFASRFLTVILAIVLAAVLMVAAILGMLYFLNRPAAAINTFTEALASRDYAALKKSNIMLDGIEQTDEGWAALCLAFQTPQSVVALKAELAGNTDAVAGVSYPSLTLEKDEFFLFIKKHYVRIAGVQMLAPGAPEGTVLTLETTSFTGTLTAEGMVYNGIMPGQYNYKLTTGESTTAPAPVEAFAIAAPTPLGTAQAGGQAGATADITIENCLTDDAVLYVGGVEVPEKPLGNIATIAGVPVGSEIRIVAQQDGKSMESAVLFADPAVPALRFETYTEVAGAPPASSLPPAPALASAEVDVVIGAFYKSYLDCINAQSLEPLQLSSDSNRQNVEARIATPANKENLFTYTTAACDAESLVEGESAGVRTLTFNATFQFSYQKRDDSAAAVETSSNRQTIQMVYVNDTWLVHNFTFVSDEDYNAHKIAAL